MALTPEERKKLEQIWGKNPLGSPAPAPIASPPASTSSLEDLWKETTGTSIDGASTTPSPSNNGEKPSLDQIWEESTGTPAPKSKEEELKLLSDEEFEQRLKESVKGKGLFGLEGMPSKEFREEKLARDRKKFLGTAKGALDFVTESTVKPIVKLPVSVAATLANSAGNAIEAYTNPNKSFQETLDSSTREINLPWLGNVNMLTKNKEGGDFDTAAGVRKTAGLGLDAVLGAAGLGAPTAVAGKAGLSKLMGSGFVKNFFRGGAQSVAKNMQRDDSSVEGALGEGLFGGLLSGGFSKAGDALTKAAPTIFRAGVNPAAGTGDKADDLAANALKLNLTGSKKAIESKAKKIVEEQGSTLSKLVEGSKQKFTRNQLVNSAVEQATELEKLGDVRGAKAMMKFIDDFRSQPDDLSAKMLWDIKKKAAGSILSDLKKGELKGPLNSAQTAKKAVWTEIWQNANDALNKIDPKVKELNLNLNTAYSILEPIERDLAKKPSVIKNLFEKILQSPTFTTKLAKGSSGLGKLLQKYNPAKNNMIPIGLQQAFVKMMSGSQEEQEQPLY